MSLIFISHSIEDAQFAQALADRLQAMGAPVWIAPNSILPGEEFVEAIQRGLSEATHFTLIMSPLAFESEWVKLEINTAIRLERQGKLKVAPIEYMPCDPPLLLGSFQWLPYNGNVNSLAGQLTQWMGLGVPQAWAKPRPMDEEEISARQQKLEKIAQEVANCTQCPLHNERLNAVAGVGPANARLMFIGEAPGPQDDETGIPFVSAAGELLTELLEMIHVDRDDVYLTNLVKCRPNANRDPKVSEMNACEGYLQAQIEIIEPDVIITLGRHSMNRLLSGEKISQIHGQPHNNNGQLIIPMYHPAAALYRARFRIILIKDFLDMEEYLASRQLD